MIKAILKTIGAFFVVLFIFGLVESMINSESDQVNAGEGEMVENQRLGIDFEIIKDESGRFKRSVEVVLAERVDEAQLETLAQALYQEGFDNTFIGYYIQGEGDYAYWATTHYTPDLNVRIIGSNQDEEQNLSGDGANIDGEILGKWRVNRGYSSVITIVETDDEKRLIQRFQDGSQMDNPLQESTVNGRTRLSDGIGESNGEYYIIGDDGKLQFWSNNGHYYTAPIDE